MKIIRFIKNNALFSATLFLLAFIPLYPKLPIVNVRNTWVYVRLEDFAVLSILLFWIFLFLKKKVTLKTPITVPILIYWVIGGIATLHGVLLLFPLLTGVFANVAFLSYLRRIEYMSLFFVAYSSVKNKDALKYVGIALPFILLAIVGYGFGQHFLGFPAFLTMNEEFAKGIPITLSALSRVPSTFAGQYDLAAYLVLVIPIIVSLAFGFKNWLIKLFLLLTSTLAFGLLFLTVSRVSFVVLLFSLAVLLVAQKKKIVVASLIVLTALLLVFSPTLLKRFTSTVSRVNVLVDTKTGTALGNVKQVPAVYFKDKLVVLQYADPRTASFSAVKVPFEMIPSTAQLLIPSNAPNGETLPQGTSYINLPLSPVIAASKVYFYEKPGEKVGTQSAAHEISGDFVVKRAKAYDLSFTTRFQGEWPKTLLAFERNIFLGSGYGSVSLAVDNDYLRLLGESGLLGFIAFFSVFAIAGIYIKKIFPKVNSPIARSFILGFAAGTLGLVLNAILIDVFEASKIAFVYWLLMGVVLGTLTLYKDSEINLLKEFKKVLTSTVAVIVYLFIGTLTLFSTAASYYFVGDDFTWLRWAQDCGSCNLAKNVFGYFTNSGGFFYRPGTKVYFDLMYRFFWLNQTSYHLVSIAAHFIVALLVFFVLKKIVKNFAFSVACAFVFLILSGYSESVFWISSTGFLFNAAFSLLGLLSFIYWREKGKKFYIAASVICLIVGMFFHEVGVIAPILLIAYDVVFVQNLNLRKLMSEKAYLLVLSPLAFYLPLRFVASSHWFNGDYSYNLVKLPFNVVGNLIGYISLVAIGPMTTPIYENLRNFSKGHVIAVAALLIILVVFLVVLYKKLIGRINLQDKKILIFGFSFFVISLLPFLGLGNITSRYSYLPSIGVAIIVVFVFTKIYVFLMQSGKQVAILISVIIVITFVSSHLFQTQKISGDWKNAGLRSKGVLTALEYIYVHYPQYSKDIYLPIRQGDAWVFPVGLQDAVWLDISSKDFVIHQAGSSEEAFNLIGDSMGKVFQFDDKGIFVEMIKTSSGQIQPISQTSTTSNLAK